VTSKPNSFSNDRLDDHEDQLNELRERVEGLNQIVAELHDTMQTVRHRLGLIREESEPATWGGNKQSIGYNNRIGQ